MGHIASDHNFHISANSKCNGILPPRNPLMPVHCSIAPQRPDNNCLSVSPSRRRSIATLWRPSPATATHPAGSIMLTTIWGHLMKILNSVFRSTAPQTPRSKLRTKCSVISFVHMTAHGFILIRSRPSAALLVSPAPQGEPAKNRCQSNPNVGSHYHGSIS
jgi:hypothetical protein